MTSPKLPKKSGNRTRSGRKRYNQGIYKIINEDKYMGNLSKCIYRSGWELKMFIFLDRNDKILRWASENISIIYHEKNKHGVVKPHRYYPDIYYELMINNDPHNFRRVVGEIKPMKETQPPKQPTKFTVKAYETFEYQLKTYKKNITKWEAAIKWCKHHQMEFVIIHEGHLKQNNIM